MSLGNQAPQEKSLPQGHIATRRQGRTWGLPRYAAKEGARLQLPFAHTPTVLAHFEAALSVDRFATYVAAVGNDWNHVREAHFLATIAAPAGTKATRSKKR